MKTYKTTGKIDSKKRLNNSVNGNPRYEVCVTISGENGPLFLCGKTASDASCGYGNWREGDKAEIWHHRTATGNVVFDHIKEMRG